MDPLLLVAQLVLLALGANAVAVSRPELFQGHLVRAGIALLATLLASRISLPWLVRQARGLYLLGLLLLAVTLFAGVEINHARRWLLLGGFLLQSSEIVKLLLVFYLARFFAVHGPDYPVFGPVSAIAFAVALVALEPDFAGAVFLLLLALFILLAIGVPMRRLLAIGVATVLMATALQGLYLGRFRHVLARFNAYLEGGELTYQIERARRAILEGGLLGQGPGAPMPHVPYAYNDMSFATVAFALGLVGVVILFLAYTVVFIRGMQIAAHLEGALSVAAIGLTGMIGLEAVLHIGVVLGLLPATGLPLPLVSYGGSAMLTTGVAFGLLHGAARRAFKEAGGESGEAA